MWVQTNRDDIPTDAIRVGLDRDGGEMYVGRAYHENDVLPAKVIPNHKVAYVAWNGKEYAKSEYEVREVNPSLDITETWENW